MEKLIVMVVLIIVGSYLVMSTKPEKYRCPNCGTEKPLVKKYETVKAYYQGGGDYLGESTDSWRECPDCETKTKR